MKKIISKCLCRFFRPPIWLCSLLRPYVLFVFLKFCKVVWEPRSKIELN